MRISAGASLRVQDLLRYVSGPDAVDGLVLIDWNWTTQAANVEGTLFTFERPVSFFSLEAGDWGSDDDGPLE